MFKLPSCWCRVSGSNGVYWSASLVPAVPLSLSVSPRLSLRVSVWHLIDDTSYRVSESLITAGASDWSVSTHTGLWLVTGPHVTSPPAPSRLILSTNVRQFGQKRLIFCCAVFIYLHRQGNISHFPPQQEFTALLEYACRSLERVSSVQSTLETALPASSALLPVITLLIRWFLTRDQRPFVLWHYVCYLCQGSPMPILPVPRAGTLRDTCPVVSSIPSPVHTGQV